METEIEHFADGAGHGPIAIFLSDSGQIAFVCRRDGAMWQGEMPQTEPASPDGEPAGDMQILADKQSARFRAAAPPAAGPPAGTMSMADALDIARSHLG